MFRVLRLKWQRYFIDRSFRKKMRTLKDRHASSDDLNALSFDHYLATHDIEEGIDYTVSLKLLDKARALCSAPL